MLQGPVDRTRERPRAGQLLTQGRGQLHVDLELVGGETGDHPLGTGGDVLPREADHLDEPGTGRGVATIIVRRQPQQRPYRHPTGSGHVGDDRRIGRVGAVFAHGHDHEPVRPALGGRLGVGAVQHAHLEHGVGHAAIIADAGKIVGVTPREALLQARALVLHDLQARGLADAVSVSMLESALAGRGWWVDQWADGVAYVGGLVAQDVQDSLFDKATRWPLCTDCAVAVEHALRVEPELGADPHWVCEESASVVARVGAL